MKSNGWKQRAISTERSKRQIAGKPTCQLCSIRQQTNARRASIRWAFTSPTRVGRRFFKQSSERRNQMLSLQIVLIVTLPSAGMLSAQSQTPTQPPVGVKRVPAAALGQTPPKNVPPLLQQYDFGGQLRALDGSVLPSDVKPELLAPGVPNGGAPKDFRPKSDVPLTPTALEAVRVSERWQGEKNAPLPGPDGRVMYSFGAGLPTVVCAPLRVCMIEMQAGEKIVGEPHIGDSVRWNISPAMYGTGDQATAVIILKPQTPGLDTNLLITTDRRAYYLRLISKPEDYVARVAFAYPEDDTRKWQQQVAAQQALAKQEKHGAEVPPAVI